MSKWKKRCWTSKVRPDNLFNLTWYGRVVVEYQCCTIVCWPVLYCCELGLTLYLLPLNWSIEEIFCRCVASLPFDLLLYSVKLQICANSRQLNSMKKLWESECGIRGWSDAINVKSWGYFTWHDGHNPITGVNRIHTWFVKLLRWDCSIMLVAGEIVIHPIMFSSQSPPFNFLRCFHQPSL